MCGQGLRGGHGAALSGCAARAPAQRRCLQSASSAIPHCMNEPALSVILITHNEAGDIAAGLGSVSFADEWIVVDSGSTDAT